MMAAVLFLFAAEKKSLIWSGDGFRQHYIALAYYGKWLRGIFKNIFLYHTFEIPLWDFSIGYGSDIIATFHYYAIGDPLAFFSIFFPFSYTEYLYGALIVLRLYLAGLCFCCYCFERKKTGAAVLAGALCYAFCGYAVFSSVRHPFFINPMICLPLLLVGAERILQRKKPALFIFMVFVSAASNFYFFYMLVFAVCFYVLVRFVASRHYPVDAFDIPGGGI